MMGILYKLKIITKEMMRDTLPENVFTIEKYFTGKYFGLIPDSNIQYYPEYRLPTLEERKQILHYSDSVDKNYFEKRHCNYCKFCLKKFPYFIADSLPNHKRNINIDIFPTYIKEYSCTPSNGKGIYHIRGNVGEWTSEKNISVGGGWIDKKEEILANDTFSIFTQNAWIGFRNVCTWKKWELKHINYNFVTDLLHFSLF